MGFRFRRSIKLVPGVRLNLSSGGVSASFGGKGFRATVGKSGVRTTASIPGTGLSYSAHSGRIKRQKSDFVAVPSLAEPAPTMQPAIWYVHVNQEARGPFTVHVLRQALTQGTLSSRDWVWRDGLSEWIHAGQEPTFAEPVPQPIRTKRWSAKNAFFIALALTVVAAVLNYKDILNDWAVLSEADFAAAMCKRLLGLPIVVAALVWLLNFYHR